MSQFGLLLVTDEKSIQAACRGWLPPSSNPITKKMTNPFTGEPVEVTSHVPEDVNERLDCASLDEVCEQLRNAQPVSIDFQLSSLLRKDFLDASKPILVGYDEEGPVMLDRIPADLEIKAVDHFSEEIGAFSDPAVRSEKNLSMFVLVYSF